LNESEFKSRLGRLEQVAKTVEKLPVEIRAEAFELLKTYITGDAEAPKRKSKPPKDAEDERDDPDVSGDTEEEFFSKFDHDKPADNAKLIAAYFYREYGAEPFSLDEVRQKADDVGVTLPARIDMTFGAAKEKGKKLFARSGRGRFKPTVHGEADLKATYGVKRGKRKRSESSE
jgi:hypothetical protein